MTNDAKLDYYYTYKLNSQKNKPRFKGYIWKIETGFWVINGSSMFNQGLYFQTLDLTKTIGFAKPGSRKFFDSGYSV